MVISVVRMRWKVWISSLSSALPLEMACPMDAISDSSRVRFVEYLGPRDRRWVSLSSSVVADPVARDDSGADGVELGL